MQIGVVGKGKRVADDLRYLREQGVIHRDVKPRNALVRPRSSRSDQQPQLKVKVCDFGPSKCTYLTGTKNYIGTGISKCLAEYRQPNDGSLFNMCELEWAQDINKHSHTVRWQGAEFFLKCYNEEEKEIFEHEASLQIRFNHPNVMSVVALFEGVGRHKYGILMDLMEEDLEAYLRRHSCKLGLLEKVSILLQLADGLGYLHEQGVIHRDVKPQNVLVRRRTSSSDEQQQQLEVKVCDFGESKCTNLTGTKKRGTGMYRAPEVLNDDEERGYDKSVDVYSFAMTAYRVLVEKEPFYEYTGPRTAPLIREVIEEGRRPDLESVDDAVCPPHLKRCLRTWWAGDPNTRPSFRDISWHLYLYLIVEEQLLEMRPHDSDATRRRR